MKKILKAAIIGLMIFTLSACKENVVCQCPSDVPSIEEIVIEISNQTSLLYEEVKHETVTVFSGDSLGSGFVFEEDGTSAYIITNEHVIKNNFSTEVLFYNNVRMSAEVLWKSKLEDIAFLKIARNANYKVATLGSSQDSKVGESVFAIGTPLDVNYRATLTTGVISGKDFYVENVDRFMTLIDVVINPGNSGGPLYNLEGEVIGVNTLRHISPGETISGTTVKFYDSLNFSTPIDRVSKIWQIYKSTGTYQRPYLEIEYKEIATLSGVQKTQYLINPEIINGLYVTRNLIPGVAIDIILEVNGKKIYRSSDFEYEIYKFSPGNTIELLVVNKDGTNEVIKSLIVSGKSE